MIDDHLTPAIACYKPMQIEKSMEVEKAQPSQPKRSKVQLQFEDEEAGPSKPAAIARITLNDCLACSGCVTTEEAAFVTQQSTAEFLRRLQDGKDQLVVVVSSFLLVNEVAAGHHLGFRGAKRHLPLLRHA